MFGDKLSCHMQLKCITKRVNNEDFIHDLSLPCTDCVSLAVASNEMFGYAARARDTLLYQDPKMLMEQTIFTGMKTMTLRRNHSSSEVFGGHVALEKKYRTARSDEWRCLQTTNLGVGFPPNRS